MKFIGGAKKGHNKDDGYSSVYNGLIDRYESLKKKNAYNLKQEEEAQKELEAFIASHYDKSQYTEKKLEELI